MLICFFRLCLLLAFLLGSGCLGGPKVDPPEVTGEGAAGIGGPYRTANSGEQTDGPMDDGEMDGGIVIPPATETAGGTGGQDGGLDVSKDSDTGSFNDDDAGSTREP